MKRFLPLIIFISFCTGTAQAQKLKETDDLLDKQVLAVALDGPQMALLEMKRELGLTEEQLAKVETLNQERFLRMTEAESAQSDPLKLQRQFREIQVELDKVLAGILTDKQLKQYLELEGRQYTQFLTGKEEEE